MFDFEVWLRKYTPLKVGIVYVLGDYYLSTVNDKVIIKGTTLKEVCTEFDRLFDREF